MTHTVPGPALWFPLVLFYIFPEPFFCEKLTLGLPNGCEACMEFNISVALADRQEQLKRLILTMISP